MNRVRSLVALLIVVGLVLPLLAGCGPSEEAPPAPTEAAEAPAAPAEPGKPFAGREITVLLIADKTWAPELVTEFEEATGAKVNVALSGFEEMMTKFTAAAAAQSGAFDVVSGDQPA